VKETKVSAGQKIELTESKHNRIGRTRMKGSGEFPDCRTACDALGAALGASRAAVDSGWIDHHHSGRPNWKNSFANLVNCMRISGAIQHLAGMSSQNTS